MLLVVYSVHSPKGFNSPTCCQHDFISTRVLGHKLCDVIDATFVSHPHAVLQGAVLGDLHLAEDGERGGLLCGLPSAAVCPLWLQEDAEKHQSYKLTNTCVEQSWENPTNRSEVGQWSL